MIGALLTVHGTGMLKLIMQICTQENQSNTSKRSIKNNLVPRPVDTPADGAVEESQSPTNIDFSWEPISIGNFVATEMPQVFTKDLQALAKESNISTPFDAHKVEYLDDLGGVLAVVGEDGLIAISNTGSDWQVLEVPEEFENKTFVYCESFRSRAAFYTDDGEILIS